MNEENLMRQAQEEGIRRHCVGAIVVRDKKVLVLQRPKDDFMGGIYELPGGKMEGEETLLQALDREILEETGLPITKIGNHLGNMDYDSSKGLRTRQFFFIVEVGEGEVVLQEHDAHSWVDMENYLEFNMTDEVKRLIREFFSGEWQK